MVNKGNITIRQAVFVVLTILCSYTAAMGEVIYVDDDARGINDGSSWENAFNYLQDALAVASDGDEIRVAQGIYTPDCNSAISDGTGDREATFQLRSNISLKGGYAGFGQIDPDARDIEAYRTILSGDLNGDDIDVNDPAELESEPTREENIYHVVTCSSNAILDGFTITGGNANGPRLGTNLYRSGAGMYNNGGSPTLINCIFKGNCGHNNGGGIYNKGGNSNLVNCIIIGNYSNFDGGGIYNELSNTSMTNCTITDNFAGSEGGGIYNEGSNPSLINWELIEISKWNNYIELYISQNKKITNCTFIDNMSHSGGGMYNDNSSPILIDCKFIGNATNFRGGGIYDDNGSNPILNKCILIGNSSSQKGGGIYHEANFFNEGSLIMVSSIFIRNLAQNNGGGIDLYRSKMYLRNCTFNLNSAEYGATLACESFGANHCVAEINNCILWDGSNGIWIEENTFEGASIINISYSNIRGGWEGLDNIDEDPLFVDQLGPDHTIGTEDDDLRLVPVSPCVDTGDPDYAAGPNETDLDGNPRIVSGLLDMGAYEFQGTVYVDDDAPYEQWQGEPEINHLEEDGQ